jgi:transcriptional regulator with XRE-family HTH domain
VGVLTASYALSMAAFPELLRKDRERRGFTVGQVAWRLDVKPQKYRELEAGERFPDFETWDRICKLYGWPQTFIGADAVALHETDG